MKHPRRWLAGVGAAVVIAGGATATIACTCETPLFPGEGSTPCNPGIGCGTAPSCTVTISSGLQTAIDNATGGEVICLAESGSPYPAFDTVDQDPASLVVVRPADGADIVTAIQTVARSSNWRFTGLGGRWALHGITSTQGDNTDMQWDNINFTLGVIFRANIGNGGIVFDHNEYVDLSPVLCEGRICVCGVGPCNPSTDPDSELKVIFSNNYFSGGCSDGIQEYGIYGVQIGPGNEFTGITQAGCGPHVDPVQIQGGCCYTITGNWFHDNGTGTGVPVLFSPGPFSDQVLTGNVLETNFACGACYANCTDCTATNNVFLNHALNLESATGTTPATEMTMYDNIFLVDPPVFEGGPPRVGGSITDENHNLCVVTRSTCNDPTDVFGTPTFVGGASPLSFDSYYDYRLADGSAGKGAGTGGEDIGIP